jgi:DNA-binding transcriptional MerR regulator
MKGSLGTSTKNKEYLYAGELANLVGLKLTTIRYYSDLGLLTFEQDGDGARRKYPKQESLKAIKEIQKMKDKRYTIEEIREKYTKYQITKDE